MYLELLQILNPFPSYIKLMFCSCIIHHWEAQSLDRVGEGFGDWMLC
jgi:hypothetical protein